MRGLLPSISLPASRAGIAVVPLAAVMMGTASTFSYATGISLGLLSWNFAMGTMGIASTFSWAARISLGLL
jgi:hypothetical protein